jgi:hypothetical protein
VILWQTTIWTGQNGSKLLQLRLLERFTDLANKIRNIWNYIILSRAKNRLPGQKRFCWHQ